LYELPGGRLASVSGDNVVRIRDMADSGKITTLECRGRWVTSLCILPGGVLASASGSHTSTETASRIRVALASCCPEAELFSLLAFQLQKSGP